MKFGDTNTISRACHFHIRAGCREMDSAATPQRDNEKFMVYKMTTICARKQ
jgi:hypothetical protein